MHPPYIPLRVVLGLVAVLHLFIGIFGVIPSSPLSFVLVFYGGALQFSPQIAHLLQMFGVYMLTIGVLCIYAIWDPVKHKSVIHGIIFLLLLRGIQRILAVGRVPVVFGLVPDYYWIQTFLFLGVGVALLWLRPKSMKATKA